MPRKVNALILSPRSSLHLPDLSSDNRSAFDNSNRSIDQLGWYQISIRNFLFSFLSPPKIVINIKKPTVTSRSVEKVAG